MILDCYNFCLNKYTTICPLVENDLLLFFGFKAKAFNMNAFVRKKDNHSQVKVSISSVLSVQHK